MLTSTARRYKRRTPPPAVIAVGGYEALAAAVVWQALIDARAGDADAAQWLVTEGAGWLHLLAPATFDVAAALGNALGSVQPAARPRRARRPCPRPSGVGALVRAARERAGLTQTALAAAAGMPSTYLSDIELAKVRPRPATLARLAAALGLPADVFAAPDAA